MKINWSLGLLHCGLVCGLLFWASLMLPSTASGQEPPADAPRLGDVELSTSCQPRAHGELERGLALLHHMMYEQAERAFRVAADSDTECAMAHWGIAMSFVHPAWPDQPDRDALERGRAEVEMARSLSSTPRERGYIDAIGAYYDNSQTLDHGARLRAFSKEMDHLHRAYPDDVEASALYALTLIGTASSSDKTLANQHRAAAILAEILDGLPTHPGALHYSIHAHDFPLLAGDAIEVAHSYDDVAPEVPHALHMPTHIYVRIGLWPDVIYWNERSAEASLRYPVGVAVSHHYTHAMDYLMYAHLQRADDRAAQRVLDEIASTRQYQPTFISAYALAAIPARYALERRRWSDAARLPLRSPAAIPWEEYPEVEAITHFARGIGAVRSGDTAAGRGEAKSLALLRQGAAQAGREYWGQQVEIQRLAVEAWISHAEGDDERALELMRMAAELEDSTEKHPVTPGAVLPARELLGDLLLELGRPTEALQAYEASLVISPGRFGSVYGAARAAGLAGQDDAKRSHFEDLLRMTAPATPGRERLEEAKASLERG